MPVRYNSGPGLVSPRHRTANESQLLSSAAISTRDATSVTATKASTSVYNASWSLIEHSESRAIEEYESEVAALTNHRKSMPIQKAKVNE